MRAPGVKLGDRYRLDERIGAGGMGEVWRATDELLGRTVAVKVMLPAMLDEPGFVRRFFAEARAMASVNHPGVVAIHDFRGDADSAFLVMEYVQSESLSQTLGRIGQFSPAAAMDLLAQAASALQAAHDRGIVHRDIKPGNLLMRADGSVVLTDFGIARTQDHTSLTTAGAILGTPSYLAPEQVIGHPASFVSDLYGLGLVAYECLAGRRPFEGESPFAVAMQRVWEQPRELGDDIPPQVAAVVERALAKEPAERWQTAGELAAAARHALIGLPSGRDHLAGYGAAPGGTATVRQVRATDQGRSGGPSPEAPPPGLFTSLPPKLVASSPSGALAPAVESLPASSGRSASLAEPVVVGRRGARSRRQRRQVAIVAVVLGVALAGTGVWIQMGHASRPSSSAATPGSPPQSGATSVAAVTVPAGFVRCGDQFCPAAPMCWGGLTLIGGIPHPFGPSNATNCTTGRRSLPCL